MSLVLLNLVEVVISKLFGLGKSQPLDVQANAMQKSQDTQHAEAHQLDVGQGDDSHGQKKHRGGQKHQELLHAQSGHQGVQQDGPHKPASAEQNWGVSYQLQKAVEPFMFVA